MAAISINLPDDLAKASQEIALQLHMSRANFIRQAIAYQIKIFEKYQHQQELIKAFKSMQEHPSYLAEIENLDSAFPNTLPDEEENWWQKK